MQNLAECNSKFNSERLFITPQSEENSLLKNCHHKSIRKVTVSKHNANETAGSHLRIILWGNIFLGENAMDEMKKSQRSTEKKL